jgi:predicted PurR-regulated permease PerM
MSNRTLMVGSAAVLVLGFFIYALQPILMPFLVAAFLAYIGDPLADRLEARGLSRTLAVCVVFVLFIIVFVLAVLVLVPSLVHQVDLLAQRLPNILRWLQDEVMPWLTATLGLENLNLPLEDIRKALLENWRQAGSAAAPLLKQLSASSMALIATFANIVLIPVVTFYLLRDWDHLVAWLRESLPRRVEDKTVAIVTECDAVLSEFFRGQLSIMVILGLIYSLGLWLIGVEGSLLLGMIAGLSSIVPYLGVVVGLLLSSMAALVQSSDVTILMWVGLVFGVGQLLEGMVLTPWLIGDRIGLHPVAVIFAILAGGQLFGFIGVLLALPVGAVVVVFLRHLHDHYRQSDLYHKSKES